MKRYSYGERDYAFGQRMLTLRTRLVAGCDAGPGPDLHGVGFGLGTLAVGVVAAVATLAARRHPQADQHEPVAGSKAA